MGNPAWQTISLLISRIAPVLSYFLIRPHLPNDVAALAIAWFIPVLWTLISSLWRRRLNVLGMLGVAAYGITLGISISTGAGSLPLKLHHAVVGGLVGLVFLGSVAIGKPILVIIARRVAGNTSPAGIYQPDARKSRRSAEHDTVDAVHRRRGAGGRALQAALALTLSTSSFLIATTFVHIAVVACAVGLAVLVIWLRLRGTV